MKIKHKEQELEAYDLLMTKENALDIISGKKKVEIRSGSQFYMKMFLDFSDPENLSMKQTPVLHFRNYNKTWFLDVVINSAGYCYLDSETIKEFNDDYNFHDLDEEAKKYDNLKDEDKPVFFWFEVGEVLATNIAQFKK